jgi:hypothetical protein
VGSFEGEEPAFLGTNHQPPTCSFWKSGRRYLYVEPR